VLQPGKSPPTDEQHVVRVERNKISSGILPPAFLRDIHNRSFDKLEQGLLHALAGDVTGDADVLALATYLERIKGGREGGREEGRMRPPTYYFLFPRPRHTSHIHLKSQVEPVQW